MVGIPAPGMDLKLVPREGKLEALVRGPNITPGYWRQEELSREAFDEEGFYRSGDAVTLKDGERLSFSFLFLFLGAPPPGAPFPPFPHRTPGPGRFRRPHPGRSRLHGSRRRQRSSCASCGPA